MKIWNSHAAEHSANMRIVGKFKSVDDAKNAASLLKELTAAVLEVGDDKKAFDKRIAHVYQDVDPTWVSNMDMSELAFEYDVEQSGSHIFIHTEETQFDALIKALLHFHAKVEVYSQHDYPLGKA